MTVEEALAVVKTILDQASLNDLQETIFRQSWEQKTYPEIAEIAGYDADYIKLTGWQLWKVLSEALAEKVTKSNFRSVLRRWRELHISQSEMQPVEMQVIAPSEGYQDWGEAIDVSVFYGRTQELTILEEWIVREHCRLIAVLGIGGSGKTALSIKIAEQIHNQFEYVIWRSLHNAPALDSLLNSLLAIFSNQNLDLPEDIHQSITKLLEYLKKHRCLLVLDNVETILSSPNEFGLNSRAGCYRAGFEQYGELFQRIGESRHNSCLILTSREKPKEVAALEGKTFPVRSLHLSGLTVTDAREILSAKGNFSGSESDWQKLISSYAGNPLALKIVSTTISDLFAGNIARFLSQGTVIFGDIQDLLDDQFNRLSSLEKELMYWLAINREPVAIADLQTDLLSPVLPAQLLEALESLERRCVLERATRPFSEKGTAFFTLQPVLMEYVTHQLIKQVCQEIVTQQLSIYKSHALIKAQVKDYIQDIQIGLIITPVIQHLLHRFGNAEAITQHLMYILAPLRRKLPTETGYAPGNTLNLLRYLQVDLSEFDFSNLTVWQADLRGLNLHRVNFSHSDLAKSNFTESFSHIYSLAVSPDGKLIALADTHSDISLWQISDGKPIMSWEAHIGTVRSIVFSPDGQTLISGGDDYLAKQWDVGTGQCRQTFLGHKGGVWSVAFSPDGQILASSSADCTIKLWNIKTGECLKTLSGWAWIGFVTFSPDSQILVGSDIDGLIKLWNVATGELLKTLEGHQHIVWSVRFSPDNRTLISGGTDQTMRWWDVETGECLRKLHSHQGWIWSLACSPDQQMLASCSGDTTIKLWDINTGEIIKTLHGHTHGVRVVAFADGRTLISSDENQTMKMWDILTGQCLRTFRGHSSGLWAIAFSPDGQMLASSGEGQTVKLWDVQTGRCLKILKGHSVWVRFVAFSPDGQTVASCGADGLVQLWNVSTGQCLRIFRGHTSFVWSVIYSPDGQCLASSGIDHSVRIWDIHTGECLKVLDHNCLVAAIAYSPDGQILASCSVDQSLRIWDVRTGQCLKMLQEQSDWGWTDWGWCVAFSPDGQTLASGRKNSLIWIWDVATGERLKVLEGHTSLVVTVAYSADGEILASAGMDQTVRIWDTKTGECLKVLAGHTKWVYAIAFTVLPTESGSDERSVLASSSEDRTIRFWDIETGECLKIFRSERPYEGMNITGAVGLSEAQRLTLLALGAIEIS